MTVAGGERSVTAGVINAASVAAVVDAAVVCGGRLIECRGRG